MTSKLGDRLTFYVLWQTRRHNNTLLTLVNSTLVNVNAPVVATTS